MHKPGGLPQEHSRQRGLQYRFPDNERTGNRRRLLRVAGGKRRRHRRHSHCHVAGADHRHRPGLVDGDNGLLRKALLAEASGVVLVLCMALLIGVIHRDAPLTREILARTRPTLLDLIIALAGGAAGAYASTSPRLSAGLVGVAIATALVPPLSACGICLGRGEASLGFGAFVLFVTNLVAIQFASSVVLGLCGFNKLTLRSELGRSVILRNASSFVILAILGLVLSLHAVQTLTNHLFEAETRAKLMQALQAYPGAELIDLGFQRATDKVVVTAEIKAHRPFGPEQV